VAAGAWKGVPLAAGLADAGTWPDAFDYCRGKCRTNPKSTVRAAPTTRARARVAPARANARPRLT
jgi:hypothetical protein